MVCLDVNPLYADVFEEDADVKDLVTKPETCLVEYYNSVLRYYLTRLHRKIKCYSKSKKMLGFSIKLMVYEKDYCLSSWRYYKQAPEEINEWWKKRGL